MSIDQNTVKKVANLARVKLDDVAIQGYTEELSGVLAWVEQLSEVNTDNVEPTSGTVMTGLRMREDEVNDGFYPEKIVDNAPLSEDNFFLVPKVVE